MAILTIDTYGEWAYSETLTIAAGSEPHPDTDQGWQMTAWDYDEFDGGAEITICLKRERAEEVISFLSEYLERTK